MHVPAVPARPILLPPAGLLAPLCGDPRRLQLALRPRLAAPRVPSGDERIELRLRPLALLCPGLLLASGPLDGLHFLDARGLLHLVAPGEGLALGLVDAPQALVHREVQGLLDGDEGGVVDRLQLVAAVG